VKFEEKNMEAKVIRAVIVHRTQLVGTAMANILSNEPDIQIVGCVTKTSEAMALLAESPCDLVVVNAAPVSSDALDFVRTLTQQYPAMKVIVMGLSNIPEVILQYFQAGATGYTDQGDTIAELLKKIRCACDGEALISPRVAAALAARVAELSRLLTTSHPQRQDRLTLQMQYKELTRREHQILVLIEEGLSNQEIADRLTIELGTVKNHVHSILRKLNVESRRHAVLLKRLIFEHDEFRTVDERKRITPHLPTRFHDPLTPQELS
jgi:two-component system, NarL family, nitrate/nitrite response regulator NarL